MPSARARSAMRLQQDRLAVAPRAVEQDALSRRDAAGEFVEPPFGKGESRVPAGEKRRHLARPRPKRVPVASGPDHDRSLPQQSGPAPPARDYAGLREKRPSASTVTAPYTAPNRAPNNGLAPSNPEAAATAVVTTARLSGSRRGWRSPAYRPPAREGAAPASAQRGAEPDGKRRGHPSASCPARDRTLNGTKPAAAVT